MEKNIVIEIKSTFLPQFSDYNKPEFIFAYYITIINNEKESIKLLERHWEITDANSNTRIVDGKGVVGEQPIIKYGETYRYNSFCPLPTEFGKMSGYYKMKNEKGHFFKTKIPAFNLIMPSHLN